MSLDRTIGPAHSQSKHPTSKLAGPYGHPLHPMLVAVPIGAWVMSFVFDIASRWAGDPDALVKGAFWLIIAGIVSALVAAVFGFLDLLAIPRRTRAFRVGVTHMVINLTVVVLFAISLAVRGGSLDAGDSTIVGVTLSAIALALLAISGWLGGQLAYHYGVRVADEETQATGFRTE